MIIEGPLMEPGTYQGIDGNKIAYTSEVLSKGAEETGVGKPVIYRHTEKDGEEKELVVGYSAMIADDAGKLSHRLAIYNPDVFGFIEDETFDAISPEIDVEGTYDESTGVVNAEEIVFTSYALTDHTRKGIPTAAIDSRKMIHISLERRKQDMDDKKKYETAFNQIPEVDRLELARKFLEEQGKYVADEAPEIPEVEEEETTLPATGVDQKVVDEILKKTADQATELAYFQDKELAGITADIKKLDAEFDSTIMLEGAETFMIKKVRLEQYQTMLNRVIPRVKLELAGKAPGQIDETKKIKIEAALEMYGSIESAKEYAPELFPEDTK